MSINWILQKDKISIKDIERVEDKLGIEYPEDYKKTIVENNGAYPEPDTFSFGNHTDEVFEKLINFSLEEDGNILEVYSSLKDRLPNRVIPFGRDPFGNCICFKYSDGSLQVVFWDHEYPSKVEYICDTFSDLLNQLR